MKRRHTMTVVRNDQIAKDTYELILQNETIATEAKPGQFIHIAVPGHTLRRPLSIANVDRINNEVAVLYKVIGKGTARLTQFSSQDQLDVLGPNGSSYPINDLEVNDSVILIGGGIGVPPLYFLAKTLNERGVNVQAILGFQSKSYVFYESKFAQFAKTYIVTDDGSYGKKGLVTDELPHVASFVRFYSCGPLPMLKAVKEALADYDGYLSFEERMGCGIGACYACVIPTNDERGYKKICSDGPVIRASEVTL